MIILQCPSCLGFGKLRPLFSTQTAREFLTHCCFTCKRSKGARHEKKCPVINPHDKNEQVLYLFASLGDEDDA